jgi:hypothetical protein
LIVIGRVTRSVNAALTTFATCTGDTDLGLFWVQRLASPNRQRLHGTGVANELAGSSGERSRIKRASRLIGHKETQAERRIVMLNSVSGRQELDLVNMLIRALSDEISEERTRYSERAPGGKVAEEMEEALYELRLRKLLISAFFESDNVDDNMTRH